jgi:hypothetical protein
MEGTMSYTVNDQRKQTMLKRIGEAAELIDNMSYLPFYRSIQIKLEKDGHPEEWARMIATAKEKANPKRYFATLCKMVKLGKYHFVEKVKEITGHAALYLQDRLVRFNFGKYQKYWVRKAQEFINANSQADFEALLEFADRKGISQKYMAKALLNCKAPGKYYAENVLGAAK